jgi:hypothetical protein
MTCTKCHIGTEPGQLYCSNCRRAELVAEEAAKVAAIGPAGCPKCGHCEPIAKPIATKAGKVGDGSGYYPLFAHLADELGLTLFESELYEIARLARECEVCECYRMKSATCYNEFDTVQLICGEFKYCPWCGRKVKG